MYQASGSIIPLALPRLTQRIHSPPLNFIIYDALDLENASLHPVIDDSFFEHTTHRQNFGFTTKEIAQRFSY